VKRRELITLIGSAVAWPLAARAQQQPRRIGVLMPFDPQDAFGQQILAALRQGLAQHGWIEGRNISSDIRWIGGDEERRRAYAAELVRAAPEAIFACFPVQLAALARETRQIPLVFVGVTDPVRMGYVASFARPGGNITGFTFFEQSLAGKWIGLLKEIAPELAKVAVVVNPDTSKSYELYLDQFAIAAGTSKVEPMSMLVRSAGELESAIEEVAKRPHSGVVVLPDTFTADRRELIVALMARHRLPAVYQFSEAVRIGGLLSYGPDQIDVVRRSASYIDRILKGEPPGELPVQAPTRFELAINLKTAKALGLTVPPSLLARADEGRERPRGLRKRLAGPKSGCPHTVRL
jgi:putative ABC transport system substrate-binding protein